MFLNTTNLSLLFLTVLQPCTNTSRNTIDFQLFWRSGISNSDKMSDIPLSVLENMSKKDMESFILYLRERPLLNANTTKQGVSQTTINRTLSALSSLYKYLTEEVENDQGEPYFYRNVNEKSFNQEKERNFLLLE